MIRSPCTVKQSGIGTNLLCVVILKIKPGGEPVHLGVVVEWLEQHGYGPESRRKA